MLRKPEPRKRLFPFTQVIPQANLTSASVVATAIFG
jgi:hypothetical protein